MREFVRSHLRIKNIVSNVELLIKTMLRKDISVDYDNNVFGYYATAHVRYGHIPSPLIWRIVRKFGKFQFSGFKSYHECYNFHNSKTYYVIEIEETWHIAAYDNLLEAERIMNASPYYCAIFTNLYSAVAEIIDFVR